MCIRDRQGTTGINQFGGGGTEISATPFGGIQYIIQACNSRGCSDSVQTDLVTPWANAPDPGCDIKTEIDANLNYSCVLTYVNDFPAKTITNDENSALSTLSGETILTFKCGTSVTISSQYKDFLASKTTKSFSKACPTTG